MARYLVDEDLPRSIIRMAGARGIDALHAIDAGIRGATDPVVMAWAASEGRTVVTADREMGNVFVYPPTKFSGVMLVRIPEFIGPDLRVERVVAALQEFSGVELAGTIVVVEAGRVRVRRFVR